VPLPGRPAIRVEGLDDTRRALRRAGATSATKAIRAAHKTTAKLVEGESRSKASGATRQQARAARSMLGKGTVKAAALALRNTGSIPYGIGAYMGSKAYAQFPDWVGNAWDLAAGEGPYVVAEAISENLDEILDLFETEIRDAIESAGLDVT
jgi:hypothetical protein